MTAIHRLCERSDGSLGVWTEQACICRECGCLRYLFISRDGVTRCVQCDEEFVGRVGGGEVNLNLKEIDL